MNKARKAIEAFDSALSGEVGAAEVKSDRIDPIEKVPKTTPTQYICKNCGAKYGEPVATCLLCGKTDILVDYGDSASTIINKPEGTPDWFGVW